MAEYEIRITPVVPSASTTGGWRWVVTDDTGQAYSSPNVYGDSDGAKEAAEGFARLLDGATIYNFLTGGS